MRLPALGLFSLLRDTLAPPRQTELVVRNLSLERLREMRALDTATLPYHEPAVTALVWEIKYYANKHALSLGGALLAETLMDMAAEEISKPLLVPVPMYKARRKKRGHNQTELLCRSALAEISGQYDYAPNLLVRQVDTPPQQTLPKHVRGKNVRHSMAVRDPMRVKGRVCVIVDDVMTTGATLAEAKRALKAAGARRVKFAVLAHS